MRHAESRLVIGLLLMVLLAGATPGEAQRTTFNPLFGLLASFYSNLGALGVEDTESDVALRLRIVLPVTRQNQRSTLNFTYSPVLERFDSASKLNNISHYVILGYQSQPTRTGTLNLNALYSLTQDQGDPLDEDDGNLFLVQRTERQRIELGLAYSQRLRGQWFWAATAGFLAWQYRPIEGVENPDAVPIEDKTETRGSFGISKGISATTRVGVAYEARLFELELGEEQITHALYLTVGREITDRLSLEAHIGGYHRQTRDTDEEDNGARLVLTLLRQFRKVDLRLLARHRPSSGGARLGTSVNSVLGLSVNKRQFRRWTWGLATRYSYRSPDAEAQDPTETIGVRLSIGVRIYRSFSIRLEPTYVKQLGTDDESLYLLGRTGLQWRPLEGTALGGQS